MYPCDDGNFPYPRFSSDNLDRWVISASSFGNSPYLSLALSSPAAACCCALISSSFFFCSGFLGRLLGVFRSLLQCTFAWCTICLDHRIGLSTGPEVNLRTWCSVLLRVGRGQRKNKSEAARRCLLDASKYLDMSQKSVFGDRFGDLPAKHLPFGKRLQAQPYQDTPFNLVASRFSTATMLIKHFSLLIAPQLVYIHVGKRHWRSC